MSDLLLQPPLSVASHDEAGPNGQEQEAAMWGSIALAALDDDDEANDTDEKKDDDGDSGVVLTATSSDIGSVQSRAKDGHEPNASMDDGGGNAFGEYQSIDGDIPSIFFANVLFIYAEVNNLIDYCLFLSLSSYKLYIIYIHRYFHRRPSHRRRSQRAGDPSDAGNPIPPAAMSRGRAAPFGQS